MKKKQHLQFCTGIDASCYNEAERLQLHEFCGFFKSNDFTFFALSMTEVLMVQKIF
jgi:hypothetical protein|tara:strand:+ start:78 stop:245 length:168 start_codon:yes stop_codon:yes gene_type:complete